MSVNSEQDDVHSSPKIVLNIPYDNILFIGGERNAYGKLVIILTETPGVNVRLLAPQIDSSIHRLAKKYPNLLIEQREYSEDDIAQAEYIVVGFNEKSKCEKIKELVERHAKLVYFIKRLEWSDFYITSQANNERILKILESEEDRQDTIATLKWKRAMFLIVFAFLCMIVGYLLFTKTPVKEVVDYTAASIDKLNEHGNLFYWLILTGFIAEFINGSVGMGYKVITMAILNSVGLFMPSTVSASTHTASMFSGGVLGYSHYRFGNLNKKLLQALIVPALIGAILGAASVAIWGDEYSHLIKKAMAVYTGLLGIRILYTTLRTQQRKHKNGAKRYGLLAWFGGFLDSFAGGGWGPIMTSSLISSGRTPRFVIGTVSVVEFFICVASVMTFILMGKIGALAVIIALVIGGVVASPLAALAAGKLPKKPAYIVVALLVILWSLKVLFF